jgi:hypothetical protein
MKYTKYFSGIINQYGRPNLSKDQFKKFMNIVHLEGRLEGLNSIKRTLEGSKDAHRFDMEYYRVNRQLTDLTGNLTPQELKQQLFR